MINEIRATKDIVTFVSDERLMKPLTFEEIHHELIKLMGIPQRYIYADFGTPMIHISVSSPVIDFIKSDKWHRMSQRERNEWLGFK